MTSRDRLRIIRERDGAKAIALGKGTKSGTSVDDVERWLGRFLYLLGSPELDVDDPRL